MNEYGSAVVAVPDCVVVVYDRCSSIAGEALADELMRVARKKSGGVQSAYFEAWTEVLEPFFEVGALVAWLSLLDGVYKIGATGHHGLRENKSTFNDNFLGRRLGRIVNLNCPSGEIMVGSMRSLLEGNSHCLLKVRPGRYLVGLEHDEEQEGIHGALAKIEEYPPNEGPDWTIHFYPFND